MGQTHPGGAGQAPCAGAARTAPQRRPRGRARSSAWWPRPFTVDFRRSGYEEKSEQLKIQELSLDLLVSAMPIRL